VRHGILDCGRRERGREDLAFEADVDDARALGDPTALTTRPDDPLLKE
jgi:hypothetical protein